MHPGVRRHLPHDKPWIPVRELGPEDLKGVLSGQLTRRFGDGTNRTWTGTC